MDKKTFSIPQEQMTGWLAELITGAGITDVSLGDGMLQFTMVTLLGNVTVILPADAVTGLLMGEKE